jgi:hypothetical protein
MFYLALVFSRAGELGTAHPHHALVSRGADGLRASSALPVDLYLVPRYLSTPSRVEKIRLLYLVVGGVRR